MNLVVDLLGGLWTYVALAGAAIAGLVALYVKGHKDAARKAEVKSLRAIVKANNDRKEIDNAINAEVNLVDIARSSGVVRNPKPKH